MVEICYPTPCTHRYVPEIKEYVLRADLQARPVALTKGALSNFALGLCTTG